MIDTKIICKEIMAIMKKHKIQGWAYAIAINDIASEGSGGYGASYPTGTETELTKKLKIMISDINSDAPCKKGDKVPFYTKGKKEIEK